MSVGRFRTQKWKDPPPLRNFSAEIVQAPKKSFLRRDSASEKNFSAEIVQAKKISPQR